MTCALTVCVRPFCARGLCKVHWQTAHLICNLRKKDRVLALGPAQA